MKQIALALALALVSLFPTTSRAYYIDATGGDCPLFGNWDPYSRTCTLTQDISETIILNASFITLDGNGHAIRNAGYAIWRADWGSNQSLPTLTGITIKNFIIDSCYMGMSLKKVSNSVVVNNRISNCTEGLWLFWSCSDNRIENNVFENFSFRGLFFFTAFRTDIANNTIRGSKGDYGSAIDFALATGNTVRDNLIIDNNYGINGNSGGNLVYNNYFSNVVANVGGVTTHTFNVAQSPGPNIVDGPYLGGNYWSNPDGTGHSDTCDDYFPTDGFCDTPYVIPVPEGTATGTDFLPLTRYNLPPVADAGADQSTHVRVVVSLDGGASHDPDQNYPLAYAWRILSKPDGSAATLLDSSTAMPSFVPDRPGDYMVELVVTDATGRRSLPDQVQVSTLNSSPIADAGPDRAVVAIGTTVQLEGGRSYDVDGDPLSFQWRFLAVPPGSAAALSDPSAAAPTFVADAHGDYLLQLTVADIWGASATDTVAVSFNQVRPVAAAGVNQSVIEGSTVFLDGRGSFDANGDPLTYSWSLASVPAGSAAQLSNPASVTPSFVADLPGEYVANLIVNDGFESSQPSSITVIAISRQDALLLALQDQIAGINALPESAFHNPNLRNALTSKVIAVIKMVEGAQYQAALNKMEYDVAAKFDGCAFSGSGEATDWIAGCDDQAAVYPLAARAIELLKLLQ